MYLKFGERIFGHYKWLSDVSRMYPYITHISFSEVDNTAGGQSLFTTNHGVHFVASRQIEAHNTKGHYNIDTVSAEGNRFSELSRNNSSISKIR